MKKVKLLVPLILFFFVVLAQDPPASIKNPILSGFNPDPSICRVGDDYYLVTSSFTFYPGIPIYHSKDLVNWQLIGHGIDRPNMINLKGLNDNDGIWAVTIRYHDGLFYLITTCNKRGGNFYITAKNPRGPWSDPVWLKEANGIDPSLFWDSDGRCYYTGNTWDFEKQWPSQCAIWMQELDLRQQKLVGKRKILTYGHANNATFAEGPHIYKVNNKYLLLMAEGGSSYHHAITVFHSDSLWGPYVADKTNPVLTHRHLGCNQFIQGLGHADLVQTQTGDWYSVLLGKRMIENNNPLARETFLSKVAFENGTPIFNPGIGMILPEAKRPNLPWTPLLPEISKDDFNDFKLAIDWYSVRIPKTEFYRIQQGKLHLKLQPQVVDSLTSSSMILKKTKHHSFQATMLIDFTTKKANEEAGLILYRTANGYYSLTKTNNQIILTKKHKEQKEIIGQIRYTQKPVHLRIDADGLNAKFSFGETMEHMVEMGGLQRLDVISDNKYNKFNGTGVGLYATANGKNSDNVASFDWFEYKEKNSQ